MAWYWITLIFVYSGCFGFGFIDAIEHMIRDEPAEEIIEYIGMGIIAFLSGLFGPAIIWFRLEDAREARGKRR